MRLRNLTAAIILTSLAGMSPALADREYSDGIHSSYGDDNNARPSTYRSQSRRQSARALRAGASRLGGPSLARASLGGRPRAWCGWWMRTQLGGGPEFNVAANWRRWGRPAQAHVGAVVVWPHHVGMITGQAANGKWIVKSGNDGGAVRERARSVSGAVFRAG